MNGTSHYVQTVQVFFKSWLICQGARLGVRRPAFSFLICFCLVTSLSGKSSKMEWTLLLWSILGCMDPQMLKINILFVNWYFLSLLLVANVFLKNWIIYHSLKQQTWLKSSKLVSILFENESWSPKSKNTKVQKFQYVGLFMMARFPGECECFSWTKIACMKEYGFSKMNTKTVFIFGLIILLHCHR